MENTELYLLELYETYQSMPLATNNRPAVLYDRKYVVLTGLGGWIPPDPHRHYTFEEFVEAYDSNDNFRKFIEDPNPRI